MKNLLIFLSTCLFLTCGSHKTSTFEGIFYISDTYGSNCPVSLNETGESEKVTFIPELENAVCNETYDSLYSKLVNKKTIRCTASPAETSYKFVEFLSTGRVYEVFNGYGDSPYLFSVTGGSLRDDAPGNDGEHQIDSANITGTAFHVRIKKYHSDGSPYIADNSSPEQSQGTDTLNFNTDSAYVEGTDLLPVIEAKREMTEGYFIFGQMTFSQCRGMSCLE